MADEDDGMMLNFEMPASGRLFRPAATIKGGRWTDRHKAKRQQDRRAAERAKAKAVAATAEFNIASSTAKPGPKPELKSKSNTPSNADASAEASRKRKRSDRGDADHPNLPPQSQQQQQKQQQQQQQQHQQGQFVSSLWTGNPEATTVPDAPAAEEEAQEPSNAPLADGSATFTTLGLSTVLANHLTTKLSLRAPTAIQRSAIPELLATDSDAFLQAETGSGKTLTYLLPIIDRIMRTSSADSRAAGLFAVILAPTRELSRQIFNVLTSLIHAKNGPHWIVPGQVIGGEKKKSEKARLRKGVNILVATPGRLLDHLQTTECLHVERVRWLVLDEGDRLMELGFEETITKILDILEQKSGVARDKDADEVLPRRRVTMLCSATMKANVQKLGERSLKAALYIKAEKNSEEASTDADATDDTKFTAPAQLRQSYVVVPAKLRLVALNAVLKRAFIRETACPKVIVFFSCSDSVDFHFETFSRKSTPEEESKKTPKRGASKAASKHAPATTTTTDQPTGSESSPTSSSTKKPLPPNPAVSSAPLLAPNVLLHKLHGSLAQPLRTATLHSFTTAKTPAVLFCTDVAARGLDLPNVDLVVQFDPPFAADDHLHRIGRTARAGRPGRAVMFLLPGPEEGYVDAVLRTGVREGQLVRTDLDEIVRKGFAIGKEAGDKKAAAAEEKRREWEDRATEWHLDVERWVLASPAMTDAARKAWASHIRAYTTHTSAEKRFFNHRAVHYGHLAKAFGLRDKPGDIKVPSSTGGGGGRGDFGKDRRKSLPGEGKAAAKKRLLEDVGDAAGDEGRKKMQKMARIMQKSAAGEFNIG